jgi:flagellar hook-associated protein FlgK
MIGPIQASVAAIAGYGKEMASVSDRISKAFQEDSDVSLETEFAKSALIEHGLNANIKVIRAQDEMLGSVLNIVA